MLVLIDGRSVYNPDFSGVYWNMEDVLLEDVERIEVIRGPGGTLWGANAVNGVINVITKNAKDTQGAYLMAGGGSHERMLDAFRYGGEIGEDLHYRIYGKYFDRGPGLDPSGQVDDSWQQGRFGFRADWLPDRDKSNAFTIQGDHFVGDTANSIIPMDFSTSERQTGENLLMRWRHIYDEDSDWTLQTYYDNFSRGNSLQMETVKTFDVDFQYRFPLGNRQEITCGANFRNVDSFYAGGDQFTNWFPYPDFTTNYTGQFIQDEIAIVDDRRGADVGHETRTESVHRHRVPTHRKALVGSRPQTFHLGRDLACRSHAVAGRRAVPGDIYRVFPRPFIRASWATAASCLKI